MPVIVGFVSQKGGVGKSTLSRALATVAANGGWKVRIADLDPAQRTSTLWNSRRQDHKITPELDVRPYERMGDAMKFAGDVDLLIIDGPARTSAGTLSIAQAAHLLVQPSNGHLDDLIPGVNAFHELAREGVERIKMRFALCRIGTTSEEQRARAYVEEAGYACLAGALYEKPAYGQAQDLGHAVIETRFGSLNGQADKLIESLLDAVIAQGGTATEAKPGAKPATTTKLKASAA
ncbi:MAG TPA: ParA family protein [Rhabdaerophilum sp.]|nr:ParA family protein [Rhabdaerophilum sp.]